jgi:hypothetical protein
LLGKYWKSFILTFLNLLILVSVWDIAAAYAWILCVSMHKDISPEENVVIFVTSYELTSNPMLAGICCTPYKLLLLSLAVTFLEIFHFLLSCEEEHQIHQGP